MKKILFLTVALVGLSVAANAQSVKVARVNTQDVMAFSSGGRFGQNKARIFRQRFAGRARDHAGRIQQQARILQQGQGYHDSRNSFAERA